MHKSASQNEENSYVYVNEREKNVFSREKLIFRQLKTVYARCDLIAENAERIYLKDASL